MSITTQHLQRLMEQKGTPLWGGYVNMLKNMEAAFMAPEHWILEFLQNAEDARAKRFSIRIGTDFIWILNDGKEFADENFYAICDVNSRKRPSAGFFGYLGIGFKSIFRISNRIDIHSGNFHFRFDEEYWDESIRNQIPIHEWPWEILPIEIEADTADLPERYVTGFYIPLKNDTGQGLLKEITSYLTGEDFPKEAVLQLKNIKTIEVQTSQSSFTIIKEIEQSETLPIGTKDVVLIKKRIVGSPATEEDRYLIFSRTITVPADIRKDHNTARVRRSDVKEREIGVVFGLDEENVLKPLKGKFAFVCSFMPVKGEQTGLPFGISGDFIPHYGRQIINYEAAWNHWICTEIVKVFGNAVDVLLSNPIWADFPADILDEVQSNSGNEFWDKEVREPIKNLLESKQIYDGNRPEDVIIVNPDVNPTLKKHLERITGKIVLLQKREKHPRSPKHKVEVIPGVYELLQHRLEVVESLKEQPSELSTLYRELENLTSYYLSGRGGRNGERPLSSIHFVLAKDNEFYPPNKMMMIGTDLVNIPGFLKPLIPMDKKLLHHMIAKDEDTVEQLKRCDLMIINEDILIGRIQKLVENIESSDDCPESWKYPWDVIEATLFLVSKGEAPDCYLIAQDETFHDPKNLFFPNGPLNWLPLWGANLLPEMQPVHKQYFDKKLLEEYGLSSEDVWQYFHQSKVRGFKADKDKDLIRLAAESIAKERLEKQGHKIEKVSGRTELGYDLKCEGHCNKVFEVKGMVEPGDLDLQPSEWRIAQDKKEDAVLVCVYNLPNTLDKIGYKEIPDFQQICKPVAEAKVPRDAWMKV